jgi:hypothetical protein
MRERQEPKGWFADRRSDMEILNSRQELAVWGFISAEFCIVLLAVNFQAHAIVSTKLV